jgi:hypothetical protein
LPLPVIGPLAIILSVGTAGGLTPAQMASFAGGIALAALGGFLVAPVSSVFPGMGDGKLVLSFVVVVLGGIGSVAGAAAATNSPAASGRCSPSAALDADPSILNKHLGV